ncbi:MAG: hypothetical protein IPK22_15490 [Verrucomicrobiaceae bacterium]|nr:hypothetical protein [Verrucomicrobiaceae bacterium]
MSGTIRFMEGKNGTQNRKGECSDAAGTRIKFSDNDEFTNDDARSVILLNVREGAVIRIYDNTDGKTSDDYMVIKVKKLVQQYIVGTFEENIDDDVVTATYYPNNGLNGKVSRVEVD